MFSIIVPSYNRAAEIPALLESLTKQTCQNFEVIIVDDASTTPVEVKQDYGFPVQVIRNNPNQGAAESRNIGARAASQEWLLFLDDDDRFAPTKCETLAKAIEADQAVNFLYHPAKCVMVNEGFSYQTNPIAPEKISLEAILQANKIGGMPMIAIKKAYFFALGGLATDLKSLEDYEFALKVAASPNLHALKVDAPLSICGFHTQRASVSTNTTNTELAIAQIREKYVKTDAQAQAFAINALYMLAYPCAMNLSRQAAYYYFQMFKLSRNFKHLAIAVVSFISPKLAINLKRFF